MITICQLVARKPALTLAQLTASAEFQELSEQQKSAVLMLIQSEDHDPTSAVMASYNCASRTAAMRMSHRVFKVRKILRALRLFYGVDGKAEFLRELDRLIQDPHATVAKVRAMELFAKAQGWVAVGAGGRPPKGEAKAAPRKYRVGERVLVNGEECRVTKIDENGRPLEAEPVGAKHAN